MRGAVYARMRDATEVGFYKHYVAEVYRHMWAQPRKIDDPQVVMAALGESGLPADDLAADVGSAEVKQQLVANTEASVARGVFGSPGFFVGEELYFGKDALASVEAETARRTSL